MAEDNHVCVYNKYKQVQEKSDELVHIEVAASLSNYLCMVTCTSSLR